MATVQVPRHSQILAGTPVSIVLKADQATGKLTAGNVADVLTRHDHPRGVKVRLVDGQIGRVQSISSLRSRPEQAESTAPRLPSDSPGMGERRLGGFVQDDYRNDPTPLEERSLEDYIKKPAQKKKNKNKRLQPNDETRIGRTSAVGTSTGEERDAPETQDKTASQAELEQGFPALDSALIAAILADHPDDLGRARETLKQLSAG